MFRLSISVSDVHCYLCNTAFANEEALQLHLENLEAFLKAFCKHCKSFIRFEECMLHLDITYSCTLCKLILSKQNFLDHKCLHKPSSQELANSRRKECGVCEKLFFNCEDMNSHIQDIHSSRTKNFCKCCGVGYNNRNGFLRHLASHTNERSDMPPQQTFSCGDCDVEFHQKRSLMIHERMVHKKESSKSTKPKKNAKERSSLVTKIIKKIKKRDLKCRKCAKTFRTKELRDRHLKNHSFKRKYAKNTQKSKKPKLRSTKTYRTSYACDLCNKSCSTSKSLSQHRYMSHSSSKKTFTCKSCGKTFHRKQLFQYHEARHLKDFKIKCSICGKGFYRNSDYKVHYEAKHEGTRFACEKCGKFYADAHCLKRHLTTHDSSYKKKDYDCPSCGKTYRSKGGLNKHVNSHKNVLYICDICGISINSLTSLSDHLMLHTGEKPFVCDTCGKSFNKKMLLTIHERIHTKEKPYTCRFCDRKFTQKSSLNTHVKYHKGERPYTCRICKKGYVTKTLLRRHSKTHGIVVVDT